MRTVNSGFKTMAVDGLTITEQWIREKLNLQHNCLADVRSLTLPGTYEWKIGHLGTSLKNFVRLKSLDLSHNALVTVKGLERLERLERLNLYFNRLASLQDVFSLHKLQNLQDLDLRLNPVVKKQPQYRLYLIHAMTRLRKLDDCPVRDRERKAALMLLSSEPNLDTEEKKHISTQHTTSRSSELRIKAMQKTMKTLALLEGNEEVALNDVSEKTWNRKRSEAPSVRCEDEGRENPCESDVIHLINDSDCQWPSEEKQVSFAPKSWDHKTEPLRDAVKSSSSCPDFPTLEGPVGSHRVTFVSPVVKSRHSHTTRSVRGQSAFTPHPTDSQEYDHTAPKWQIQLEDRSNPVLHPPRLTIKNTGRSRRTPSESERKHNTKGSYRKPMELLLGMMEDLWSDRKENQQNRTFLVKMVEILRMMERDVERGEQEIQTLRETTERQQEQQRSEIEELTLRLQQEHESTNVLKEQLKCVLEENVSLQKQLIRAQHELLSTRLKTPAVQHRGVQSVPEELNDRPHAVEEGHAANEQQESYRCLIARNERLLLQLEEALLRT